MPAYPNHGSSLDEAEIRRIESRYDEAWNQADLHGLAELLADDALVVNPHGEAVQGRAAFRSVVAEVLGGRFAGTRHESSIRRIQFITPDVALVDGHARITGLRGATSTLVHAFTDVFVQRGGRWEIAAIRAYAFSFSDPENNSQPAPPAEIIGEGRPLVIVGGGLTGALSWVPHAEALADRRRVARVQPIGVQCGVEHVPLPAGYSIRYEAEALRAALDNAGWTKPVDVVGWSMGGTIALDFALNHRERVRTLVLVEPDVPWILSPQDRADPEVRKAEEDARQWADGVTEEALAQFMDEMLGDGAAAREHPRWPVWNAHRDALRAINAIYQHEDDVRRLAAFDAPVLLVKGEGTPRYNLMMVDTLQRLLPGPRVAELPGGHLAPVVALDEFLAVMESFQGDEPPGGHAR
jgi:uncharacterized protein (TIGR02246 family)